jgi:hypothetical protein
VLALWTAMLAIAYLCVAMVVSLVLLIVTGASGGAADPASAVGFKGWGPLTAAQVHLAVASLTLSINAAVNIAEYLALRRNGWIVNKVLTEVRRMRLERGLDVQELLPGGIHAATPTRSADEAGTPIQMQNAELKMQK